MFQPPRKIVPALSLLESILGVAKNEKDSIIDSILNSEMILSYLEVLACMPTTFVVCQWHEVDASKTRGGIMGTERQQKLAQERPCGGYTGQASCLRGKPEMQSFALWSCDSSATKSLAERSFSQQPW